MVLCAQADVKSWLALATPSFIERHLENYFKLVQSAHDET